MFRRLEASAPSAAPRTFMFSNPNHLRRKSSATIDFLPPGFGILQHSAEPADSKNNHRKPMKLKMRNFNLVRAALLPAAIHPA
jgi:hypothetical protein